MNLSKLVNSKGKCSKLTKHAINHNFDHNHNFVTFVNFRTGKYQGLSKKESAVIDQIISGQQNEPRLTMSLRAAKTYEF